MNETSGTSDNSASSVNETSGRGRRRRRVAPTSSPTLQSTNQQHGWQCSVKVVFMRHEASDLPSFICRAASDEQAGDGMNFMFLIFQTRLISVKIITMSTTNSEVPIRMHRGSTDASRSSGSTMQGTEVENKFARNEVVRIDQTCVSRHQRDTFGISWHIGWKLVVVSFSQKCQVHVLHGLVRIPICDRVSTSTEIRDGRAVPKEPRASLESFVSTSPSSAAAE